MTVPPAVVRTCKVKVLFAEAAVVGLMVSVVDPEPKTEAGEHV